MTAATVDILMYHSISTDAGPTSIAPSVFADQMAAITDAGIPVVSMDSFLAARRDGVTLPGTRAVVITFDDGFEDFAEVALPILQDHQFPSLVYLPTDYVGRAANWPGSGNPPRRLMSWSVVRELSDGGVSFGSHSVTHPDLNSLAEDALDAELSVSRLEIEERLGKKCLHFAAPYGRAADAAQRQIRTQYQTSAGTRLAQADLRSDLFDLPRLEMYYFQEMDRWQAHLAGEGSAYLRRRRIFRNVRAIGTGWFQ